MDDFRRECLLGGLDEIAVTLLHEPDIRTYELRTGI
jgi:3-isopropylmalate dehydratase small subunit